MKFKNYDSTLSISNYEISDLCAFYVHNHNLDRLVEVDEQTARRFSPKLDKVCNDQSYSNNDGQYLSFSRVIGIIVDKYESVDSKDTDKITVMFKTDDNRYVLNKYVVNYNDVFTNRKNSICPSAVLRTARD